MEAERPKGYYKEFVGTAKSWKDIGMRIKSTFPVVPGEHHKENESSFSGAALEVNKFDPITINLTVECKKPVQILDVTAWVWTHMFHADNHEGIFKETELKYVENSRDWDDNGVTTYQFQRRILPTRVQEVVRLTFYVKFKKFMIWANKNGKENILIVKPERPMSVSEFSSNVDLNLDLNHTAQITRKISIGNQMALLTAEKTNYSIGINLDPMPTNTKDDEGRLSRMSRHNILPIVHLGDDPGSNKGKLTDNSDNDKEKTTADEDMSPAKLAEIVKVLKGLNTAKDQILMCDNFGLGKVGSAMTAYIYSNNPNLSYEEAYEYVRSRKSSVYCFKGLKTLLSYMFPRD